MENSKGSEWHKWDLHIHTPKSINQEYGGDTEEIWDKFIDALNRLPEEVKVIGITDYYFIDGYEKVMEYRNDGHLKNIEKVFPILEFRIDTFGSGSENKLQKINLHILFDLDETDIKAEIDDVRDEFISQIPITKLPKHKTKMLSRETLAREAGRDLQKGFSDFIPSTEKVFELIESETWQNKTVTFLGYKEWSNLEKNNQLKPLKEYLYGKVAAFFSRNISTIEKSQQWLNEYGDKRLLHSGDIHSFEFLDTANKEPLGFYTESQNYHCDTWIKADPTFEGLKHIQYEPQNRVFIGDKPEVLKRVENDKTKYIDSLSIDQMPFYDDSKEIWFKDISIEFNKELVCIIGNKGSGKSAVSDIMGLLGNTHNSGENSSNFSFLTKDKFLQKGLANNFTGVLKWADDNPVSKQLGYPPNSEDVEKLRYLPQRYFEKLTNDLQSDEFTKTLESVIFEHLPEQDKHGKLDFKTLRTYKTVSMDADISALESKVFELNDKIVQLESMSHPNAQAEIKSQYDSKQKELVEHFKIHKNIKVAQKPFQDDKSKKEQSERLDEIKELNLKVESIMEDIEKKESERKKNLYEKEELSNLKAGLQRLKSNVTDYKKEHSDTYKQYNLDLEKILPFKLDMTSLDDSILARENQITTLDKELRSIEDCDELGDDEDTKKVSLYYQKEMAETSIKTIKENLNAKEQEYQNYLDKIRDWKEQTKVIIGGRDKIGSLKFLYSQRAYLNKKIDGEIKKAKAARMRVTMDIYKKKSELISLYDNFKKPVDKEVAKNKDFLQDYEINISSSFCLAEEFSSEMLSYINQNKRGSFYGSDGEKVLHGIIEEKDYNEPDVIESILNEIIEHLEIDMRQTCKGQVRYVSEQVDKVSEFYNYLFSLEYLNPLYELKLGEKQLSQLSPGEKGTLLLVFYLMLDVKNTPLIIDQPEDNLDNESVFMMLTEFIKQAKKKRQIILVTHNPNLAIGADAEQIIRVDIDKKNKNTFSFEAGAIEHPMINKRIVDILEGTMPAFDKRKLTYMRK